MTSRLYMNAYLKGKSTKGKKELQSILESNFEKESSQFPNTLTTTL